MDGQEEAVSHFPISVIAQFPLRAALLSLPLSVPGAGLGSPPPRQHQPRSSLCFGPTGNIG